MLSSSNCLMEIMALHMALQRLLVRGGTGYVTSFVFFLLKDVQLTFLMRLVLNYTKSNLLYIFSLSSDTTYLLLRAAVAGIKAVRVILLGGGGALSRPGGLSMHRPGGHVPHPQDYCLGLLGLS